MIKFLKILNIYRNRLIFSLKSSANQVNWKLKNSHNMTSIGRYVKDPSLITVGNHSYGILHVESFENKKEKLIIGNFVSISTNVTFILGGNHQIDAFTTYPVKANFSQHYSEDDATTKGPIIVEDEVWVGSSVIIMSGVTIGRGSIIAAGSVVTKNVQPFSIVGGNPAKFIKFRIDEGLIQKRMELDINNLSVHNLSKETLELLYQPLSNNVLDRLENEMKK